MTHRAEKPRKAKRGWIILLVVVVVLGALGSGVAVLWGSYGDAVLKRFGMVENDYPGPGTGEAVITIYEGELGGDIAETLAEADVVKSSEAFYDLLIEKADTVLVPGSYSLKQQMSAEGALEALLDPENRMQRSVALREGLTVDQTLERLAAGTGVPLEEFEEAAKNVAPYGLPAGVTSLEGWLFPANYEFGPDDDAFVMINTLVQKQRSVLASFDVSDEDAQRVLTTASIVEKEAGTPSDFGKVARVIANRLDTDMLLQMDSTAQYGYGEHADGNVWSSKEALKDDNDWNTYVHKGLPVGPIANPGANAIEATLNPEEGDWLYFVVSPGGTGESTFTSNVKDHEAAVDKYRKWCSETPDSGC
ncbi:endolytic transglycosylase MltG [Leucobacter sp. UCMA 4100]|uniref:endolytic transglycosylase MltG n=1 Tax=Leucobacter sp. UCMA 4100 TaxID=2810534 RepID=UPI0022EB696D|nr:endolytic transglycosylase MltG [Leucobacter sp. UCMA 4100]MDA3145900.1 endolytic transglycosylase MltG [Leucobacter sp. UCMA 4100]